MTPVKIMPSSGYCLGVRRAMEMVEEAIRNGPHPIWTLGDVVHNPAVITSLREKGVRTATAPEQADSGTLILRSHGTTVEEMGRIPPGVKQVDTTCPCVKRSCAMAREFASRGLFVLLVGDKAHPEARAVMSWAGPSAACIASGEELGEFLPVLAGRDVAVIAQTTARRDTVEKVLDELRSAGISVQSENTICTVTHERQEAVKDLARECQVVLVVGGRTSANTGQLLRIAQESGAEAYLVEKAEDVSPAWVAGKRVGVAAGASTPDWVIKEVVGKVEELEKSNVPLETEETKPEEKDAKEESVQAEDKSQDKTAVDMYDESFKSLQEGQIVLGKVVSVDENGALVDVGAKSEGTIPASELQRKGAFQQEPLVPGQEVLVYVVSSDAGEGGLRLSKRRADEESAWRKLEEAFKEGTVLEAPVSQEVKGGLVVDVGLRGFVPASQVERGYVNDLSRYVGKNLRVRVLELDRSKNRVVLSQRVVLESEHDKLCKETWATIAEGQVRRGTVKGITDFGVFVDLGGVDGLLHISELAWGRVKHPSEVVKEGDEIDVKVLRVDKEKGKISLGRKQVLPDPWSTVEEKYPVGAVVDGVVTRTAPFGAFVQLEPGVEGLVHISEVSMQHITKPEEAVASGDKVRVKVLRVRPDERRISLSIKQADQVVVQNEQAAPEDAAPEVTPEPAPEVTPEEAPEAAAEQTPEATPEQAQEVAGEETPEEPEAGEAPAEEEPPKPE